jgi:flagellar basal-body rod modification protein FlgD
MTTIASTATASTPSTAATAQAAPADSGSAGSVATPENPDGVLGQNDFLKLMVAQLQAQNPLEPGNSNEYLNEIAQFTQVEQMTNLASSNELSGAVQLIGHHVSYDSASGVPAKGIVQSVQSDADGTTVTIEGVAGVKLASITEVE